MVSRSVLGLFLLLSLATLSVPRAAHAGGLYLFPLGAEPAARGGAKVAGVSSPHALWYNPAGLAYAGRQLLTDFNLPLARASFTRFLDNGGIEPNVRVHGGVLPIPTIGYSDNFGLRRWGFGIGLIVPPGYALSWPDEVNGQPAPQRYSILNTDGSAIASLALAAAYRPIERLSLGVAVYLTSATVGGDVAVSVCDYAVCSQPEAPEWMGRSRFRLGPVATATALFGARYDFRRVRLGGSVQLRTKLSGKASFDIQLPDNALFDGIRLENERGGTDLQAETTILLPTIARLGVEVDLTEMLKMELAGTWENWAAQRSIEVRPIDVVARDVPGVGDVRAQTVTVARDMNNSWALHLGATQDLTVYMPKHRRFLVHGGFMLESSAIHPRDMSPVALDTRRMLVSGGASVELVPGLLLDLTYGHMFMENHVVRNSRVLLPSAIRPTAEDPNPEQYEVGDRPAIGNGRYAIEADMVAIGLRWMIDQTHPRRPEVMARRRARRPRIQVPPRPKGSLL